VRLRAGEAGRTGAVATGHPLATDAAWRAMQAGGNAVDGAIAAALMLGVVDPVNSGLGGGMFLLIRSPDGKFTAIDGREAAPAAASRDMFVRDGKAVAELSQQGPLAVAVPSQLAALAEAATAFGNRPLREPLAEAARVAGEGFVPDRTLLARMAAVRPLLPLFPGLAAQFGGAAAGAVLRQPELAETLRSLAEDGPAWFYRGPFAQRVAVWMREHGGVLTEEDFAAYRTVRRDPIAAAYRGFSVTGFPPPSSGGLHLAQMLRLLEPFDVAKLGAADRAHLLAEVMKLAFADRARWLGDPDHVKVPRGLLRESYLEALGAGLRMDRAAEIGGAGSPPDAESDHFRKHTTHFSVCDAAGWWVAATATINTTFGSKVVVPGTGVVLNNEMDDFSAQPGAANAFGLVGAEANGVAPGKRPLSSMSPTIVCSGGEPVLALGAAGGPTIISQTLLHLVGMLDLGMDAETALRQPRLHHQWRPDELMLEPGFSGEVAAELSRRGHKIRKGNAFGVSQIVARRRGGPMEAAADPRAAGSGRVW